MILKAGGDIPDSIDDPCLFFSCISKTGRSLQNEDAGWIPKSVDEPNELSRKVSISSMPFGVVSPIESSVKSNQADVGISFDCDSDGVGRRQTEGWDSEGGESMSDNIQRIDSSEMKASSDLDDCISIDKSSSRLSDIWSVAFARARNYSEEELM